MDAYSIVLATCSTQVEAEKIAKAILNQKLAACIQLLPITSFFSWEGSINNEKEVLLLIKTKVSMFAELERCIKSLHSYKIPEIIQIDIKNGSADYLGWIDSVT